MQSQGRQAEAMIRKANLLLSERDVKILSTRWLKALLSHAYRMNGAEENILKRLKSSQYSRWENINHFHVKWARGKLHQVAVGSMWRRAVLPYGPDGMIH